MIAREVEHHVALIVVGVDDVCPLPASDQVSVTPDEEPAGQVRLARVTALVPAPRDLTLRLPNRTGYMLRCQSALVEVEDDFVLPVPEDCSPQLVLESCLLPLARVRCQELVEVGSVPGSHCSRLVVVQDLRLAFACPHRVPQREDVGTLALLPWWFPELLILSVYA